MISFTREQLQTAKRQIVRSQVERFHIFYKEYFEKEETIPMVNYFFDKIYNLDGKEEWVSLALSSFDKIKSMVREETRESMERLVELNNLTDSLDLKMAELLLKTGWKDGDSLSQEEYLKIFIELDHAEERIRQVEIVLINLRQFYELAHRPINAILIKPARFMSKILGIHALFSTVEDGYHACLPVNRPLFESFFQEVKKKEYQFLYDSFPRLLNNGQK